jgi:predicted ATP-dependent serine protease
VVRKASSKLKCGQTGWVLHHPDFYLLTETSTQVIFQEIKKLKPQLIIVDSIQTLQTNFIDASPGSVSQIRECAAEFQRFAKETGTPVFSDWSHHQRREYSGAKNSGTHGGYGVTV